MTGEYPPQPGGVSDYTQIVARALAASGDIVHVFAPMCEENSVVHDNVYVHRLATKFGFSSLAYLGRQLDRMGSPLVLVQYVPHAFGHRAMNIPFALWMWSRRRKNYTVLMFHEVAYPFVVDQPLSHNLLAIVNWAMARCLISASGLLLVSTSSWRERLIALGATRQSILDCQVCSTLPDAGAPEEISAVRLILTRSSAPLIGHFGTFSRSVASMLNATLPEVMNRNPSCLTLLIGRGSVHYATMLCRSHGELSKRVFAVGELEPRDAAMHIAACDVLLQVYPDGVTSRRTSALAGLKLGVPVVSNAGHLTEAFWQKSGAIVLAESPSAAAIIDIMHATLADPEGRANVGRRGRALYEERFEIGMTMSRLREIVQTREMDCRFPRRDHR